MASNQKSSTFASQIANRMQPITTSINQTTNGSYRPKKKAYPKTLKGCFSFEEFQDLLNEKIKEHYEKV